MTVGGLLAFYGHSQGGGASAAAVEAANSYAPDLQVAAAYASAPPADLDAVQRNIEGSDLVGAIGFTINGLAARYPELAPIMDRHMNEQRKETLKNLSTMCTDEITSAYGYQRTNDWTNGGQVFYRDDVLPKIEGYNHFDQAVSGAPIGVVKQLVEAGRSRTRPRRPGSGRPSHCG